VQIGDTIRPPQALALTLREVRKGETALHRCVTAPLTQGEFDSLISLAYNVGADAVCRSTMVRLHNAGQHAQACAEFDRWVYFQGRDCRDPAHRCGGLPKRRATERAMCEGRP
jgi:lysozyme